MMGRAKDKHRSELHLGSHCQHFTARLCGTEAQGSQGKAIHDDTSWCPRSIAKLVYNSNNYGFCW